MTSVLGVWKGLWGRKTSGKAGEVWTPVRKQAAMAIMGHKGRTLRDARLGKPELGNCTVPSVPGTTL